MAHIWKHMITHKSRRMIKAHTEEREALPLTYLIFIFLVRYCIFRPVKSMEKFGNHVALLCQKSHFHKLGIHGIHALLLGSMYMRIWSAEN